MMFNVQNPITPHVLLIEDNLLAQKVTVKMLETMNCSIDVACSGEEALPLARKYYDIIFLDIGLPDIDGFEVASLIRGLKIGNRQVYMCALTAHATDAQRQKCFDAGMNAFLIKPASMNQLRDVINDAFYQVQVRSCSTSSSIHDGQWLTSPKAQLLLDSKAPAQLEHMDYDLAC